MTFVQKYLFTPALGAAGVLAGYAVYRRKHPARQSVAGDAPNPSAGESGAGLHRLAAIVDQLSKRVVAVEKGVPGEWLETLNARLASLDHRVTEQSDRMGVIESNYANIETRLDAILKSLDRRDASPAAVLTAA